MTGQPSFDVAVPTEQSLGSTLIVGQANPGMAGITAMDYLVHNLLGEQVGHVSPEGLPAIAPFEDGVPRHHSRLYTLAEHDLTVLVGELFVPAFAAQGYVDALFERADAGGVEEVAVLHGIPFAHGPDEHDVFYVATPGYRETHLAERSIRPSKSGFFDGVVGEVVTRSLDQRAPDTGVFITPTHPPGPDVEAALRLLAVLEELYGFDVDETELRTFGERVNEYYTGLAERMRAISETDAGAYDTPEDRMYM